jgi:hypothetical protein
MALINCEECGKEISNKALQCPNCGIILNAEVKIESQKNEAEQKNMNPNKIMIIVLLLVFFFSIGSLRIYTGGDIGFKLTSKESFSFTDTFVNLDDVFGKPRFLFANEHPAVKKQLEEMGILETDEQVQEKIEAEMRIKQVEILRDTEEQLAKTTKEYERQMRQLGY